jgi:hypothetical protein
MSARPSLAPRSVALVLLALGALAVVAWLGGAHVGSGEPSESGAGAAFAPGEGAQGVRIEAPEGLAAAPRPVPGLGAGARDEGSSPEVPEARRADPNATHWGPEYWSLRVLDPLGEPLPSRGMRVSVDGRETLGFTDRDARLHLARQDGAFEVRVAMRGVGSTSNWWVGTLQLPNETSAGEGEADRRGPVDLGSLRLVGVEQSSLLVLLPAGEPWSSGTLWLNGRPLSLDEQGRIPLPPHNRWGERLELRHPCLTLPAALPDRLGDDGLPLRLEWSRGALVAMRGWTTQSRLTVRARDTLATGREPEVYRGVRVDDEVRLEASELLDYRVWVVQAPLPASVSVEVRHPLWERPLASRVQHFDSLVGNVGAPWVTQPEHWADLGRVRLVDVAGLPIDGYLRAIEPASQDAEVAVEVAGRAALRRLIYLDEGGLELHAGSVQDVWLPRSGSTEVLAESYDGRARTFELRPGEQDLQLRDALEIELPITDQMRKDSEAELSLLLTAAQSGPAPRGWRSEIRSGTFPENVVRFRVPVPGRYRLSIASSRFVAGDSAFRLRDSNSLGQALVESEHTLRVTVAADGSVRTDRD